MSANDCNHSWHRLGGIEDCPVCSPPKPKPTCVYGHYVSVYDICCPTCMAIKAESKPSKVEELEKRIKEAEEALRFYAEGGSDLEPRQEKAHLYDYEYPIDSAQWRKRSMSDYQTGRRARDYFKRWGR